jgi:hypothetical protein
MNIIKNRSSLLAHNSIFENKKSCNSNGSYKNIFNKNILWVKLYDNYLYLYLNKNTNNKFSIFEPKTKINTSFTPLTLFATQPTSTQVSDQLTLSYPQEQGLGKENPNLVGAYGPASFSNGGTKIDDKIQINKNTIKLLNLSSQSGCVNDGIGPAKADTTVGNTTKVNNIKLYKYLNSIFEYKNEIVKYQNIVYQFNKNNKVKQNSSVGNNKNVFTLLESTFLSMSSLISKPFIIITPNKVVIQLFYYLNNNQLLNINNDKLQSLCLILSKIYKKPVELELDRLHYPYYDSNILSNMIGLISNIVKLRFIIKKLFTIAKIKKTNKFSNKFSIIPSYLSGFKIRVAGRLLTQRVIPRLTVKTIQRGTLARGKAQFVDSARFSNKNKRGSFSITVTMGHVFF